jgi:hypothetical protein
MTICTRDLLTRVESWQCKLSYVMAVLLRGMASKRIVYRVEKMTVSPNASSILSLFAFYFLSITRAIKNSIVEPLINHIYHPLTTTLHSIQLPAGQFLLPQIIACRCCTTLHKNGREQRESVGWLKIVPGNPLPGLRFSHLVYNRSAISQAFPAICCPGENSREGMHMMLCLCPPGLDGSVLGGI